MMNKYFLIRNTYLNYIFDYAQQNFVYKFIVIPILYKRFKVKI